MHKHTLIKTMRLLSISRVLVASNYSMLSAHAQLRRWDAHETRAIAAYLSHSI